MAAGRMSDKDTVGAMGPASLGSTSAALGGLGGRDLLGRDLRRVFHYARAVMTDMAMHLASHS